MNIDKFFNELKNCKDRNSVEPFFQANLCHNLLTYEQLKYKQDNDIVQERNSIGFIPDISISFGKFNCLVEVKRYRHYHESSFVNGLNQLAVYLK